MTKPNHNLNFTNTILWRSYYETFIVTTKSMVVLMSTEGRIGRVELRDTPTCMRSEASAVLSFLSSVLPGSVSLTATRA